MTTAAPTRPTSRPGGTRAPRPRPQTPRRAPHPDPERLLRLVARTFLEVEAGRRPLAQMEPMLCPALVKRLRDTTRSPSHTGPGPDTIISIRCVQPSPGVADAAVVVRQGRHVGAIAIRIARYRGAWRVVEIARPEDQSLPRNETTSRAVRSGASS
jgi:hypothetical protein